MSIPHDTLALYPWSCSFGWCPAKDFSAAQWFPEAQEGLYFHHLEFLICAVDMKLCT